MAEEMIDTVDQVDQQEGDGQPKPKLKVKDFAAKIKAKYPEYNNIDDAELTNRIVSKYPEYKDQIDFTTEVKKKEGGALPSTGQLKSPDQAILDYVSKVQSKNITPEQESHAKVLTQIPIEKLRNQPLLAEPTEEKVLTNAHKKLFEIAYGEGDKWKDPLKAIQEEQSQNPKNLVTNVATQELATNSIAPDGYEANKLLALSRWGKEGGDNVTANFIKDKAKKYNDVVDGLRNVTDFDPKASVRDAAVLAFAKTNPQFAKELQSAGISLDDPMLADKIPSGKMGQITEAFVNDPNVSAYLKKENPNLAPIVEDIAKNNLKDNPDYAINQVANEVSQARTKLGLNAAIINFYGKDAEEATNKVAEELYKDNPEKLAIYNSTIRNNQGDYIDAPSLLSRVASGIKGGFAGIGNTLMQPFTSEKKSVLDKWEKDASHVSADPQGFLKFTSDAGNVLGFIMSLEATAGTTGMGSLNALTAATTGDIIQEAREKYRGEPVKAAASATMNALLYRALGKDIFPGEKAKAAFEEVKPEMDKIAESLTNGAITKEAARREAQNVYSKAIDFATGTLTKDVKIAGELTGISLLNRGLDKVMMDKQTFQENHPDSEIPDSFEHNFLSNIVLAGLGKYGEMKNANNVVAESLYNAASNPKQAARLIDSESTKASFGDANEMKDNLDYISKLKQSLDIQGVDEKNQKRFIFEALQEKAKREINQPTGNEAIDRKQEEDLKVHQDVQEKILNGEDVQKKEKPEPTWQSQLDEAAAKEKPLPEDLSLKEGEKVSEEKIVNNSIEAAKDIPSEAWRNAFLENPKESLRQIAQQVHSSESEKSGAINTFTKKITDLATELYPTKESTLEKPQPEKALTEEEIKAPTEAKTELPKGELQIDDEGKIVPFSKVGKTKIMFDRENKKFTYQTPTGRESSPKQAKLAASKITPRYFRTWWKEMATDEQKEQVRSIQGEMLDLLRKAQNYEYADDIETFLMRMIKDVKFHPSILKDLTDVAKSKWTTEATGKTERFNLDTYVKDHIGLGEGGLLAQEGFHGFDEQEVMNMIKDIIRQYPNGIREKDITARTKEDNPLHQLEKLEDDFIDLTGLDINKALEIYGEEKESLDKRQTEVQAPAKTSEATTKKIENETIPPTSEVPEQIPPSEKTPAEQPTIEAGKGAEPPTEEPKVETAATGGENKVGVSHAALTDLSKKLGLKEPERGEFWSPELYAERGRKLLAEGADPNEVDNPNNSLHDRISIARAHLEDLVKKSDEIAKTNPEGINSEEYKKASQEVSAYAEKVKGLGTEAHRAMTSLQGERDIDTDSFTAVRRATEESIGKPLSKEQEKKIETLTTENQKLKQQTQELEKKLIEATDKALKEKSEKQTPKEKAKSIADKIREAKIHRPGMFSAATPASLVWDASVEVVAKTVEAGGKIAEAIEKGVRYMQSTDWYKKLNDTDKKEAEKQFKEWHEDNGIDTKEQEFEQKVKSGAVKSKMKKPLTEQEQIEEGEKELAALQKRFVNKQGNKFSIDESKAIWDYAKKNYLDKGVNYRDMLANVKDDLGLSWKQTSDALTSPKIKPVSDAMWKKQGDYRRSQIATKNWVEAQNKSLPFVALRKFSAAFRGVAVFGHGGIFIGTHAGMTLFNPSQWHVVIPAFIRGWKFAYGNKANYERRVEQLRNNPNYVLAQRAGLKNNPDIVNTEEFQKSQEFFKKIGGEAGVKGFNAIKVLRQDLFDYHYNRLSEVEKNDAESVKQIARLVNNATGATNLNLPKWVDEVTFAGGMEAARWGKLTRNPARVTAIAVKVLIKPESATTAERVFAKVWARRVGEQLATMTALLAANAAIQSTINPKNPTNLTDPNKPDYMKFKFGDITIDPTSGMRGAAMFAYSIGKIPFMNKQQLRGDTRMQAVGKLGATYARGKAAPLYSTIFDFFTQQDYNKNPMPFSADKPTPGHHKLTWGEYAWEKAPLPMAHAAQEMYRSALDNGADKLTLNHVLDGIVSGAISGGTGFRVGEYNAEESNRSPFTEEDKKDPTFKYFTDKGMELPNTSLSSEEVKDSGTKTIKKISDYPKEIQDKYISVHKEELKNELEKVKSKGYVYVNEYGEVSINHAPKSNRTKIDDLNEKQLAEVLHISQSQATQEAKKKVFYKK